MINADNSVNLFLSSLLPPVIILKEILEIIFISLVNISVVT